MNKDKKDDVFNVFGKGFNPDPYADPVDFNRLLLNSTNNLQLCLNQIIAELSAILYAVRKSYPELYELMQVGVLINEYVNRRIIADNYKSAPRTIDLKELGKMNDQIDQLALKLVEKGSGFLEDAISQYEKYLKQKGENFSEQYY